jgi:hypothetical protein
VTVYGIDVGSYQAGIDMAQVAREGFVFVFAKVGQGAGTGKVTGYGQSLNPAWPAQRDGARKAGLLLAGYWYVGNTESPASQAARCKAALGDTSIPLALDWEDASGAWSTFLAVLAAFRAAGLRVVLGYCPQWYGTAHGMTDFAATGLALWSSRYPATAPGAASVLYQAVPASYWAGYAGTPVTVLQYADSATVAGMTVDADAYAGTRDQLAALLLGGSGAASTPTPSIPREDTVAIVAGSWPAGTNIRQHITCPVGKNYVYKGGWFSLSTDWADATGVQVTFIGGRKPLGGSPTTPATLTAGDRQPLPIPDGTESISVVYTAPNPIGYSIELWTG